MLKLDLKLYDEQPWAKKAMLFLSNFFDLFSVVHSFKQLRKSLLHRRRNCTFLALTNGTFEKTDKSHNQQENQEKPLSGNFLMLKVCFPWPSYLLKVPE